MMNGNILMKARVPLLSITKASRPASPACLKSRNGPLAAPESASLHPHVDAAQFIF